MLKNNNIFLYIKCTLLYVGSVIGAGFASGQEILQFYIVYGYQSMLGILLATILFAYFGAMVLLLSVKYKTSGYHDLLPHILGNYGSHVVDILSSLMLISSIAVMFAGSGAVLTECFGSWSKIGIIITAIITVLVIIGGLNRVLTVNLYLVPLKIIALIFIVILGLLNHGILINNTSIAVLKNESQMNWFWSSILYVSYNMIVALSVLSSLGKKINKEIGLAAGITGGLILGIMAGLITIVGLSYSPEIIDHEIPLLYVANQLGTYYHFTFALLIWLAITTTAISSTHGFASRLAKQNSIKYKIAGVSICLIVLPLAQIKFANLVQVIYPIFGYAGLSILLGLLFYLPVHTIKRYKKYK
ncbi:Putative membrane protein [Desulfofarcimen acetoxidans DSM 771]|uniref:Putative membrane protein n=1 Tax=Desulfofarcimen acetoxidans (strain ATCC 49208 / DSM 771 / KCTC 5769 / VKM B-1644 / 5575) TaxID=485916 RepID=C8W054_DESAS|nr:hypothetical protein [Desulfofarcimen acetoxidans]ACV65022.1 Putative membrane protein [Desulfofarcimen acetoxidans DSM 771]